MRYLGKIKRLSVTLVEGGTKDITELHYIEPSSYAVLFVEQGGDDYLAELDELNIIAKRNTITVGESTFFFLDKPDFEFLEILSSNKSTGRENLVGYHIFDSDLSE